MPSPGCPVWEYTEVSGAAAVLRSRLRPLVQAMLAVGADTPRFAADTRPEHGSLFAGLTPPGHAYYAGHYRGEDFRCLRYYDVQTSDGDTRVGTPWHWVAHEMEGLGNLAMRGLAALDASRDTPSTILTASEKLLHTIQFACAVLEQFLRIHPYTNGNGHMARAIVWAILGRYGYHLRNWPIEPRPPDPPYTDLIRAYRSGDREPLERFLLQCVDPGPRQN